MYGFICFSLPGKKEKVRKMRGKKKNHVICHESWLQFSNDWTTSFGLQVICHDFNLERCSYVHRKDAEQTHMFWLCQPLLSSNITFPTLNLLNSWAQVKSRQLAQLSHILLRLVFKHQIPKPNCNSWSAQLSFSYF